VVEEGLEGALRATAELRGTGFEGPHHRDGAVAPPDREVIRIGAARDVVLERAGGKTERSDVFPQSFDGFGVGELQVFEILLL